MSDKYVTNVPECLLACVVALATCFPKFLARPPANGIIKIAKDANFQF